MVTKSIILGYSIGKKGRRKAKGLSKHFNFQSTNCIYPTKLATALWGGCEQLAADSMWVERKNINFQELHL